MVKKREQIVNENYYFRLLKHTNLTFHAGSHQNGLLINMAVFQSLRGRFEEKTTWFVEQ